MRICFKPQFSPIQPDVGMSRYDTVGKWLLNPSTGLSHLNPRIYSQGSLRIGTPVMLVGRNESDIGLVCKMDFDWRQVDPLHALDLLEAALKATKAKYEAHTYSGTHHRLNNDTKPRNYVAAAMLTWKLTLDFLNEYLCV